MSTVPPTPILFDPVTNQTFFSLPPTLPQSPSPPLPSSSLKPLHFKPLSSNSRLIISHAGLTVTATNSDEELAIGSLGFSEGVHYWEIYCPLSCENLGVGVIKEGFSSTKPFF